jgi:diguanylate cyclase (GGDEF)-like protein/PAS domain S-box-containing protein
VTDKKAPVEQLNEVLLALLRRPDALIFTTGEDGFRVPTPDSLVLPDHRTTPLPADRATTLDLLVPQDCLSVVTAWETAQLKGVAHTTARLRTDPERPLTVTIVDAEHSHGVWITAFSDPDAGEVQSAASAVSGALAVPLRPRTATINKSAFAVITGIDDRATRMFGWTEDQMAGARSSDFVHPDDQERAVANWLEMLSKKENVRIRLRHRCADGTWLWVEIENIYHPAEEMSDVSVTAQVSDISDEMAVHEALDRRERLLHRLAESLPTGIVQVTADRELVYANSRMSTLLHVSASADLESLLRQVTDEDLPALHAALAQALDHDADSELEVRIDSTSGGEQRVCAASVISLSDREGAPGAILSLTDVTDNVRMREELKAKATYDVLTGCHNRASIMGQLDDALRTHPSTTVVLFIDLNKFKPVNDTFGHAAGDEILLEAARRLSGVLRHEDAVGRVGGDEFLLIARGLDSTQQALTLAGRVREALFGPVSLPEGTVDLAASIGVACSEPGLNSTLLTRRADVAMYRSKQQGGSSPVLYCSSMEPETLA